MLKKIIPESFYEFYMMVAGSIIVYIISYSVSFVASILITRFLGPDGRGLFASITSLVAIGAAFIQLGLGSINKKLAAENKAMSGYLFILNVVISSAAAIFAMPVIYLFAYKIGLPVKSYVFIIILVFVPISSISQNCMEILLGGHFSKQYNIIIISEKLLYLIVVLLFIVGKVITPVTALVAFFLPVFLRMILCGFSLRGHFSYRPILSSILSKIDKSFILSYYLASIFYSFGFGILPILLTKFSTLQQVGFFSSMKIIIDVFSVTTGLASSYAVKKLVIERKQKGYIKMKIIFVASNLFVMSLVAVLSYFLADYTIPYIFGKQFRPAIPCFIHMLPGAVFTSGIQMMNSIILVDNKGKSLLIIAFIYSVLPVLLSFFINPRFDALTIANNFSIGCFITFLVSLLLEKRSMNLA